jgi:TrmH family RNA methyltransferase
VACQKAADLRSVLVEAASTGRPVLALVGMQDPGNAGTLIRVAEASGCAGVVFTEGSVDVWNPKVVRASAGSVLRMAVAEGVRASELQAAADIHGLPTVATVALGGSAPEDVELGTGCVLLVGSEAHGVPEQVSAVAGVPVTIPMEGSAESLNAAVAGALVCFEAARQRRDASQIAPSDG